MITEWTGLANVLPWKIAIKSKNNTLRSYKYTSNTSYLDVTSICIGRKQKQRTGRKIGRSLKLDWFHTTIIKQEFSLFRANADNYPYTAAENSTEL